MFVCYRNGIITLNMCSVSGQWQISSLKPVLISAIFSSIAEHEISLLSHAKRYLGFRYKNRKEGEKEDREGCFYAYDMQPWGRCKSGMKTNCFLLCCIA